MARLLSTEQLQDQLAALTELKKRPLPIYAACCHDPYLPDQDVCDRRKVPQ